MCCISMSTCLADGEVLVQTPVAIGARALHTGLQDLRTTLASWVPWYAPPALPRALVDTDGACWELGSLP